MISALVAATIFFILSLFIYRRYTFLKDNQFETIPLIYRAMDPSYLLNDWYTNENSGLSVRYFYTNLVAGLARYLTVPVTMFLIYTCSVYASGFIIFFIAQELFGNILVSIVSVTLLFFVNYIPPGASTGITRSTIPQTIAIPFVLLGFLLFLQGNYTFAFASFGISLYFQMLWGLQAAAITGTILLFHTGFTAVPSFMVFAAFAVIPFLILTTGVKGGAKEVVDTIVTRHPHHYLPSSFSAGQWIKFTVLTSAATLALFFIGLGDSVITEIFVLSLVFMLVGTVFVDGYRIPAIVKLQLYKSAWFIVLFGTIAGTYLLLSAFTVIPPQLPFISPVLLALSAGLIIATDYKPPVPENHEMYSWIMSDTPRDAIFLIPPEIEDFRVMANRAIVIDLEPFTFKDQTILEYRQRMNDVTKNRKDFFREGAYCYRLLTDKEIVQVAQKYRVSYILTDRQYDLFLIYRSGKYNIYRGNT